jgi:guanylate kinase
MSSDNLRAARRGPGFGIAFVVTGPSGAGKTSVIERVIRELPSLAFSVSHTTRARREGEIDGRDYIFVTEKAFADLVARGGFVEHTVYSGARYGTGSEQLEDLFGQGLDVILNVEVEGAAALRARGLGPRPVVLIFLAPSSLNELRTRLRARGSERDQKIAERLSVAEREMRELPTFDYLVLNDKLEDAAAELAAIITAERLHVARCAPARPSM